MNESKELNPSENANAAFFDSSESDGSLLGSGKVNKDILGMLGEELDQQTDFMCEE